MSAEEEAKFGFRWGPLVVSRCCHDAKKIGYILQITTDAGRQIEVRVSPKGEKISVEVNR